MGSGAAAHKPQCCCAQDDLHGQHAALVGSSSVPKGYLASSCFLKVSSLRDTLGAGLAQTILCTASLAEGAHTSGPTSLCLSYCHMLALLQTANKVLPVHTHCPHDAGPLTFQTVVWSALATSRRSLVPCPAHAPVPDTLLCPGLIRCADADPQSPCQPPPPAMAPGRAAFSDSIAGRTAFGVSPHAQAS